MRQRKDWEVQEDALLLKLISEHGEKWRLISRAFTSQGLDRTDDALRNRYARIKMLHTDADVIVMNELRTSELCGDMQLPEHDKHLLYMEAFTGMMTTEEMNQLISIQKLQTILQELAD